MTVVTGTDRRNDTTRVLEEGARLTERFETAFEVVRVPDRADLPDLRPRSVSGNVEGIDPGGIRSVAAEAAEPVLSGFRVTGNVGDAASGLRRVADGRDATSLVTGVRRRPPVGKAVFGSVARDVSPGCDRPVVSVPGTSEGE